MAPDSADFLFPILPFDFLLSATSVGERRRTRRERREEEDMCRRGGGPLPNGGGAGDGPHSHRV